MELLEMESLVKLGVAMVLGALVGLEREFHGRPAGIRTNALVCMASAMLIIVSRTGALVGLEGPGVVNLNVDPARMAAGIVTGIGFLGAGAILKIKDSLVRGLTTAATVWFVAAVGISVGLGEWVMAGTATGLALVLLLIFGKLDRAVASIHYRTLEVAATTDFREAVDAGCRRILSELRVSILQSDYSIDNAERSVFIRLAIRTHDHTDICLIVSRVSQLDGVAKAGVQ
jgi:putative Mg2+ transporter-C (MgtC) family protein